MSPARRAAPARAPALPPLVVEQLRRLMRAGVPKYAALKDAVIHAIAQGALAPGAKIPNESDLVALVGLSLGTVQRALRMLVDDGAVVRRPGHGTFVADRTREMAAPLHCRFVDDAAAGFLPVYTDVRARTLVAEPGPWTAHLGAPRALRIDRVLDIGGRFKVFSRFFLDPEAFPFFRTASVRELEGANFKQLIAQSTGLAVSRVRQYVSFVEADAPLRALIGCGRGPVARFELFAWAGSARPVYYQELYAPLFSERLLLGE